MNAKLLYVATTAVALLSASATALAEPSESGLTRAQVRAELMEAIKNGTLARTDADFERLADQRNAVSLRTRAEVREETLQAARANLIPRTDADIERIARAQDAIGEPVSRQQVVAELAEARRLGLLQTGDQYVFPTPRQAEQIRLAGVRAAEQVMVQASAQ